MRAIRDGVKIRERRERERAFEDGYAGRPARSPLVTYQRAYRLGVEARARDRGDAA